MSDETLASSVTDDELQGAHGTIWVNLWAGLEVRRRLCARACFRVDSLVFFSFLKLDIMSTMAKGLGMGHFVST